MCADGSMRIGHILFLRGAPRAARPPLDAASVRVRELVRDRRGHVIAVRLYRSGMTAPAPDGRR
jgi:hypothetical protein